MPPHERDGPREHGRALLPALVLVLIGGLVGVVVLSTLRGSAASAPLGGDGLAYHRLALGLLDGSGFSLADGPPYSRTVSRAPGYPVFLAACYQLVGRSPTLVRACQFGVLAATGVTLFLLLRLVVGGREAWLGGLLCVGYLPFALISTYHLSEVLACFLSTAASYFLISTRLRGEWWRAVATGLAFGALALVRPSLWLMPVLCLPLLWRRRPSGDRTLVLLAASGWLALVVPWMVRNAVVSGRFVGMGTGAGWSLFVSIQQWNGEVSFALRSSDFERTKSDFAVRQRQAELQTGSRWGAQTELLVDRAYREEAVADLGGLRGWDLVRRLPARLAYLWSTGDLAPWPPGTRIQVLAHRLAQAQFGLLVIAGMLGAWRIRWSLTWFHLLLCLPAVYVTALHLMFHVEARYTLPARVTLLFFPAQTLCSFLPIPSDAWSRLLGRVDSTQNTTASLGPPRRCG